MPPVRLRGQAVLAARRLLASAGGEAIAFGPGSVEIAVELAVAERGDDSEADVVTALLRLRSSDGRWWQGERAFTTEALSPFSADPQPRARFAGAAPPSWARALAERPLLTGVESLWDSRDQVVLDLGERRLRVPLHYQGPVLDIGWLPDDEGGDRLVIRLAGLHDDEVEEIEPFLYTLPLATLLEIPTAFVEGWLDDVECVVVPIAEP